jgi:hypothetical protein
VDDPAQDLAPWDAYAVGGPRTRVWRWVRRLELKASVAPSPVVVRGVGAKGPLQVAAAEHEHPVQALAPDRADPPLGEGVSRGEPGWGS